MWFSGRTCWVRLMVELDVLEGLFQLERLHDSMICLQALVQFFTVVMLVSYVVFLFIYLFNFRRFTSETLIFQFLHHIYIRNLCYLLSSLKHLWLLCLFSQTSANTTEPDECKLQPGQIQASRVGNCTKSGLKTNCKISPKGYLRSVCTCKESTALYVQLKEQAVLSGEAPAGPSAPSGGHIFGHTVWGNISDNYLISNSCKLQLYLK